jgi:ATP-binding cassette subfamily B (MDR/TAP) protein 7
VLKDGSVAESGTHEQLINRAGLYSELWSTQETMFNGDEVKEDAEDGVIVKKP